MYGSWNKTPKLDPVSDWHEPKSDEHDAAMGASKKKKGLLSKLAGNAQSRGSGGLVGAAAKLFAK